MGLARLAISLGRMNSADLDANNLYAPPALISAADS
jgi:hypothetical protein